MNIQLPVLVGYVVINNTYYVGLFLFYLYATLIMHDHNREIDRAARRALTTPKA